MRFTLLDAACVLFTSLPMHTQINLAHSVLQLGVWVGKQSYYGYKYLKSESKHNQPIIITVQPENEEGFIELSTS